MTASPDGPARRILLVDDDPDSRELLGLVLGHEGFLVVTVGSGQEALASVAQHPPDLILLDGRMPGMDGYEVAARLRGNPATVNIPIIMVTGMTDDASTMRALNAGAVDIIAKPIGRADVVSRVKKALRIEADGTGREK